MATRSTKTPTGPRQRLRDPFSGLSHAAGAVVSAVGLLVMLSFAGGDTTLRLGLIVYGVCLILLFSASAAAHLIHATNRVEDRLERLDYAAIFLLIAGTYTPIFLSVLSGPIGKTILLIEWVMALVGAIAIQFPTMPKRITLVMYLVMGWMVLPAVPALLRSDESAAIGWLVAGGVVFSVGAIVFATQRPQLWPGRFGSHDLWHLFVLIGGACHYAAVWHFAISGKLD